MGIQVATSQHVTAIYELMDRSRHLYTDFPESRLSECLREQSAVVGEAEGDLWGFLYIECEQRPITMPRTAPNRLYLRAIVLANKRSPIKDINQLLRAALELPTVTAKTDDPPGRVIFFSRESWPIQPLIAAGFEIVETVENFELNRLMRRWYSFEAEHAELEAQQPIKIRAATSSDFDEIAKLDGLAFDPHWHFSTEQLTTLASHHRLQVAVIDHNLSAYSIGDKHLVGNQRIAGYTALSQTIQDLSGWRLSRKMHLARIATHPDLQGKGIGRYLLLDVLKHAHSKNIDSIMLNTQSHNKRSQSLYKGYGFRRMGKSFTVLMLNVI